MKIRIPGVQPFEEFQGLAVNSTNTRQQSRVDGQITDTFCLGREVLNSMGDAHGYPHEDVS